MAAAAGWGRLRSRRFCWLSAPPEPRFGRGGPPLRSLSVQPTPPRALPRVIWISSGAEPKRALLAFQ
eukprot:2036166-Pleurochrysis_carterae.AAC.1